MKDLRNKDWRRGGEEMIPALLFALSFVFQIFFPSLLIACTFVPSGFGPREIISCSVGCPLMLTFMARPTTASESPEGLFLLNVLFYSHCKSIYTLILENLEKI